MDVDDDTIRTWQINYGLDTRSPAKAASWWSEQLRGLAPAGAVAALGICIDEITRLRAENERLRAAGIKARLALAHAEEKAPGLYTDYYNALDAALAAKGE